MEKKSNKETPQRPEGDRLLDASIVTIDLLLFMEQIKHEPSWKDSDRNSITVFKTEGMRIVLIGLHKGAEMIKHKAEGIISIQVLEGQIKFSTDLQSVELDKGQMLTLHERIPHSVLAIKETFFLLTLATLSVK
jgi:quercetin dioxygenase-like cupin family protein